MKLKLVSLNVEGTRHYERVLPFLDQENSDIICLQEASENYVELLQERGYHVSHQVRSLRNFDGINFIDGQLIASKLPHLSEEHLYYDPKDNLEPETFDSEAGRYNNKQGVLVADIEVAGKSISVANTHFTWAPDGKVTSTEQIYDMKKLLEFTTKLPPHILCGDFNLSRQHSHLYQELVKHYTDNIPEQYKSSLDKDFHRSGNDPDKQYIFTDLMVDYIFTKTPYCATDVELKFGISDHAAVISKLEINSI